MHPQFTQVPPIWDFSIIATFLPAIAAILAPAKAVVPAPKDDDVVVVNHVVTPSCLKRKEQD